MRTKKALKAIGRRRKGEEERSYAEGGCRPIQLAAERHHPFAAVNAVCCQVQFGLRSARRHPQAVQRQRRWISGSVSSALIYRLGLMCCNDVAIVLF
jgi:hypothetical protein